MKLLFRILAFLLMLGGVAKASDWPEGPWINGSPRESSIVSAIVFVSPVDLQFQRMMRIWRKLEKKYGPLNVDFLIVAMQEPLFPFSDGLVQTIVTEANYTLPVLIDSGPRYSKLWRAYVSPTVNLVLHNGRVTSFDPGNFDPFAFEKTLQKLLKESGIANLPPREYQTDVDLKSCHPHTLMAGNRFQKAWSSQSPNFVGPWNLDSLWAEKTDRAPAQVDVTLSKVEVGLLAESHGTPDRVTVSLDGQKLPVDLRGRDVQEDKGGNTYINVGLPKMYEVISHGSRLKENPSKLLFSADAKGLRIWSVELMPSCLEY